MRELAYRSRKRIGLALVLAIAALVSTVSTTSANNVATTQVGFSFSPAAAAALGLDPLAAYNELLNDLHPDVVRIPIYWSDVQANPYQFDYTQSDSLFTATANFDAATGSKTKLIPVVGMRNMDYPELHIPVWAATTSAPNVIALADSTSYTNYLSNVVGRYHNSPLISMWQLENEPLDDVNSWSEGPVALDEEDLTAERALIQNIDPGRQVLITTYDSASADQDRAGLQELEQPSLVYPYVGHPDQVLRIGDALGLDIYVATESTDLNNASAASRITWKTTALDLWKDRARQAGKQLWVTELQASPWPGVDGFTPADVVRSALAYRDVGLSGVLMWGVETWLVDPAWMTAGKQAMQIFGHVT
jgi:hypothetical protein